MKKIILSILFILLSMQVASALSVSVHVPEKYNEVYAGERFYFEIEVKYPENPERKDLRLEYEVRDSKGELVAFSKVLKAIETQASFVDYIVIPEQTVPGLHLIEVKISDYEDLSESVSASFNVVTEGTDQIKMYFFIIMGVLGVVVILVIIALARGRGTSYE